MTETKPPIKVTFKALANDLTNNVIGIILAVIITMGFKVTFSSMLYGIAYGIFYMFIADTVFLIVMIFFARNIIVIIAFIIRKLWASKGSKLDSGWLLGTLGFAVLILLPFSPISMVVAMVIAVYLLVEKVIHRKHIEDLLNAILLRLKGGKNE